MLILCPSVILICTWGDQGATAVRYFGEGKNSIWATARAWFPLNDAVNDPEVVDTVGAGDTFIAGFIFCSTHRYMSLDQKLSYATELASRKVYQDGFDGLAAKMLRGA